MEKLTKVALDAMGGDHAPGEVIKGAVDAVNACQRVKVYLVGQEKESRKNWRNTSMIKTGSKSFMRRK